MARRSTGRPRARWQPLWARSSAQAWAQPSYSPLISLKFIAHFPIPVALGDARAACYANTMTTSFHFRRLAGAVRARLVFMRKAGTFAVIGVINTGVDFGVFMTAYKV